jgi:hypothetical protein
MDECMLCIWVCACMFAEVCDAGSWCFARLHAPHRCTALCWMLQQGGAGKGGLSYDFDLKAAVPGHCHNFRHSRCGRWNIGGVAA